MTTVSLTRSVTAAPGPGGHPKMAVVADNGTRLVLPFAPIDPELGNLAPEWVEVPRAGGRAPMLILAGKRLAKITLVATIGDTRNPDASQEGLVFTAVAMARQARRVTLANYGVLVGNAWRITDLRVAATRRQYGTNAITAGVLTLELTAASDASVRVGSTSGGSRQAVASSDQVRTATIRPGETATALATRLLGDPNEFGRLLDANGLTDPRQLPAGTVLTVPAVEA